MNTKKTVFFLKNFLFRPQSIRFAKMFSAESLMDEEVRNALILSRLQRIVKKAWDNSSFYRAKYSAVGMQDGIISSLADFELLPALEKEELRAHSDDILDKNVSPHRIALSSTGGSTGIPVKVFHDKKLPIDAVGWHILNKWGGDISCNAAFFERYNPVKSIFSLNRLLWYPTKRNFLDASFINPGDMEKCWKACKKISPVYLEGYVGAVEEFANYLFKNSLSLPSVRFVWTTAAPLSEVSRKFMENVFHCPVYSQYGCCEIFWLGCECQNKKMHYFDTIRKIEVVDDQTRTLPVGEDGEFLITDLLNEIFPLIRYRNGDRGKLMAGHCECGSKFPVMGPVKGRITDLIRFPDGSCVPGDFMTTIFDHAPDSVRGFQVIQHYDYSVTIRYIPASADSGKIVEDVCQKLRMRFETHSVSVNSEVVSEIPHDRGKTRFVISELNS